MPTMQRAYSILNIKSTAEVNGKRTFSGIATTPSTDRMGDIVEPKGAEYKLPIPFLWQHNSGDPIGWITSAKVTDKGIEVEGEVANFAEDGELKDRLTKAWQMLKAKLVRGLSIGFNSIETARIEGTWGYRFLKWEWLELSAVTIAANQDATITAIKSIDQALLAASGRGHGGVSGHLPGASGQGKSVNYDRRFNRNSKGNQMKTLKELREQREQKLARMNELQENATASGVDFTEDEEKEFSNLEMDIVEIDREIKQVRIDQLNAKTAVHVEGKSSSAGSQSRGGPAIIVQRNADEAFQGQNYTRMVIAKAVSYMHLMKGEQLSAIAIAEKRWGKSNPRLVEILKADVAGGGVNSGDWGAELVDSNSQYTGDFIEYLTSRTVYDKLPLRQVPANVTIKGQDGTATGYWVGDQNPIPLSTGDFSTVDLDPLKVGAIAAISNQLLLTSSPSAEQLVRDMLVDASAQRVDTTFLSANAAVAGVSPAGLLNGVTAGTSAGTSLANVITDIKTLYAPFLTAKNASGLHFVTNPSQAKGIGLIQNSLGLDAFPGLTATGGTLKGDPVVTGDNVDGNDLILLKPSEIWRIETGGLRIEMSREATLEMSDAPTGEGATPTGQSAKTVNMFQADMTAIKVIRDINFQKRRSSAVAYITDVDYDGIDS